MHRSAPSILLPLVLASIAVGCAAPPPPEERGATDSSLSEDTCEMWQRGNRNAAVATVAIGGTALTCEAGVLATVVGAAPGTLACAPLFAGAAAGTIATGISTGLYWLVCGGQRLAFGRVVSQSGSTATTGRRYVGQTCEDSTLDAMHEKKDNICNQPRSCSGLRGSQGGAVCDEIQENVSRNSECLSIRKEIDAECFADQDPNSAEAIAHQREREAVQRSLDACLRELAFCGTAPRADADDRATPDDGVVPVKNDDPPPDGADPIDA